MIGGCKDTQTHLFNGKNLTGWYIDSPMLDSVANAPTPFVVKNGNLISSGEPRGHLITERSYKNYRLMARYRFIDQPGNCGILVHSSRARALYGMFPQSLEVQLEHTNAGDFWCIREDISVPNMDKRRGPKADWGVVEGKKRRIINLTDDSENPPGEWNEVVIECFKDQIKVWVNNDLVNHGFDCTAQSGQIAIQAEGAAVEFNAITIESIGYLSE
ncbi:MAG: DUF1080 domain-containing protein [Cyclobacteriaceae bacterium]